MQRLIAAVFGFVLVVVPGISLSHYYNIRAIANPTSVVSPAVLGAPTTTTQWFCVTATGGVVPNGGPHATQALAEQPCGVAVAGDSVTRYIEQRVTVTQSTSTTTTTRRAEVVGSTGMRLNAAHAQIIISAGGDGVPNPDSGAQALIDPARVIDWDPGVQGGIPERSSVHYTDTGG